MPPPWTSTGGRPSTPPPTLGAPGGASPPTGYSRLLLPLLLLLLVLLRLLLVLLVLLVLVLLVLLVLVLLPGQQH
jgi:hypothetical protein